MLPFPIKLKKPHSGPKPSNNNFIKIRFLHNFQLAVTSRRKLGKSNALTSYKTQKTQFGPPFVQNPQCKIFPKKLFCLILSLYAAVTSCKNSEKIHA